MQENRDNEVSVSRRLRIKGNMLKSRSISVLGKSELQTELKELGESRIT